MAATWDFRRLQQYLDKHKPKSLYFLVGDEPYLINKSVSLIKEEALKEGAVDFNFDQFYLPEAKATQIKDAVEMLPMMCPQRVVVVKGITHLKEKDWQVLLPTIENPIDSTVLIFVGEKIDKRKKWAKKAVENGVLVELKRPFDNQVAAWIDYIAYEQGLKVEKEAIDLIHQFVGTSLTEIQNEISKVAQFLGDKKIVTAQDVLKVVSKSRVDSIFDLTNAIGKSDRGAALASLVRLLDSGQNEVGALALILRHVRILAALKEGLNQGLSGVRLSSKVGVPNFFLKQYLEQSRHWNYDKITNTIEALHRTDKALKSSPVSSHIWLENFVIQACPH